MATVVYNDSEIEESIENSSTVSSNVSAIIEATSTFLNNMDKRIKEYYPDAFDKINTQNTYLNNNVGNIDSFRTWLSDTYNDYTETNAAVNDIASDAETYVGDSSLESNSLTSGTAGAVTASSITSGLENVAGGQGSADGVENYYIDPELWANLSGSEKTAIETKLKEVGYSDAEILQIKNGELSVDKTKLESLSSELEALYKNDPSIRQTIIDLYGFDIFNADGTVDETKLALLMLIDDKNSSDKYDISSLISELKQTSTTSTSSNTTSDSTSTGSSNVSTVENSKVDGTVASTSVTGAVNSNSSSSIHSGSSYSGSGSSTLSSADESLLDSFVDSSDESISDIITKSSKTSLGAVAATAGGKAIDNVKSSAVGAIPVIAGLGSTLATAGGLTMAVKKKEKDDNEEILDDDDELFNENKNDAQQIDSIKPDEKEKDNKEWLYGLGIGLAGAGAGIAYANKDNDDDDDNEKND